MKGIGRTGPGKSEDIVPEKDFITADTVRKARVLRQGVGKGNDRSRRGETLKVIPKRSQIVFLHKGVGVQAINPFFALTTGA